MPQPPLRLERIEVMPDLYRALEQLARSRATSVEELVEDTLVRLVERNRPLRVVGRDEEDASSGSGQAKVIPLNVGRGVNQKPPRDGN